jgi:ADP-heptose:LPS heptosyltransferase
VRRLRRRVNRRFYRLLFRAYRRLFPTPRWTGPLDPASVRRILVLRDDRIGDMVVTTPMLSFLRDVAPHAEIDVLASPANRPIAESHPGVSRVFVNKRSWLRTLRVARTLRKRQYDVVFSPVTRKALRESLIASMVAGPRTYKVSGWRPVRYQGLVTGIARVPPQLTHMADRVLYVAQYAFGIRPNVSQLARYPMRLATDSAATARVDEWLLANGIEHFVLVNISAGGAARDWWPARCAAFLSIVFARHSDLRVVLTQVPQSAARVGDVVRRIGTGRVVIAPMLPLADLIALVRRADMVVTPETSFIHIASACRRPVVALFGPQHPNDVPLWVPVGVPSRVLASKLGGSLNEIDPAGVADAFDELFRGTDRGDALHQSSRESASRSLS